MSEHPNAERVGRSYERPAGGDVVARQASRAQGLMVYL